MKPRIHPYVSPLNVARLRALATRPGHSESSIVENALNDYFTGAKDDERDAAIVRRLDRISRQIDRLEQKDSVLGETLALFIRYFLMVTPELPDAQIDVARAKGDQKFDQFLDQLGRNLQSGKRILQRPVDDFLADQNAFFSNEQLDRLHQPAPAQNMPEDASNA